uniref:Pollen-specific leucine-rich repeat extensin-like protein 1 n=1 Tax=Steinernema glaseri TaxID=37863 RepID=A0A1I7Z213_9BILA
MLDERRGVQFADTRHLIPRLRRSSGVPSTTKTQSTSQLFPPFRIYAWGQLMVPDSAPEKDVRKREEEMSDRVSREGISPTPCSVSLFVERSAGTEEASVDCVVRTKTATYRESLSVTVPAPKPQKVKEPRQSFVLPAPPAPKPQKVKEPSQSFVLPAPPAPPLLTPPITSPSELSGYEDVSEDESEPWILCHNPIEFFKGILKMQRGSKNVPIVLI